MKPHFPILLFFLPLVGCGASDDLSSKLVGEWQGRPETAAERLLREWPTDDKPTEEEAKQQATKTDLESLAPIRIDMKLDQNRVAELKLEEVAPTNGISSNPDLTDSGSSDSELSLTGKWLYRPTNSTQGMLEIVVEDEIDIKNADEKKSIPKERRRFLIELIVEEGVDTDRFLLVEEGADPRFGRLLFERKSS